MADRSRPETLAAYGGPGWQPRKETMADEMGSIWSSCGINSEYGRLKQVLLHRPGDELGASAEPNAVQMLDVLDIAKAQDQHDALAETYRNAGVQVHYLDLPEPPSPNQMYMADVFCMTPEGAIIARPASEVRAGEERRAAAALAANGVPILRSISGRGTFEGADMMWISAEHVIVGRGLRTNQEAIDQITAVLAPMGVRVTAVDLPVGSMHLMGLLRIIDKDLAIAWPTRIAWQAVHALNEEGIEVQYLPDLPEAIRGFAFNSVMIGAREMVMAAGNPVTQAFYERNDIRCHTVDVSELRKAAGAAGCLTGIVERELV